MIKTTITLSAVALVIWQIIEKLLFPIPLPVPLMEPYVVHGAATDVSSQIANLQGRFEAAESSYDQQITAAADSANAAMTFAMSLKSKLNEAISKQSCPNVTALENRVKVVEDWQKVHDGESKHEALDWDKAHYVPPAYHDAKGNHYTIAIPEKPNVFMKAVEQARTNGTQVLIYWTTQTKECPGCDYFRGHTWNNASMQSQLLKYEKLELLMEKWPKLSEEFKVVSVPGVTVVTPNATGYDFTTFLNKELPREPGPFLNLIQSVK